MNFRIVVLAVLTLGFASPEWASATAPFNGDPDRDPSLLIRRTIEQQLAAFNTGDRAQAFELAAPSIRRMFGSAEKFAEMVRKQYAQLHHSSGAIFLELRRVNGRFVQRVRVMGEDGEIVHANYIMVRVNDGTWRVGGVMLDKPDKDGFTTPIRMAPPEGPDVIP
jgi:hypothetical protein